MGDEELQAFLSYSRHEISENVARWFKIRNLANQICSPGNEFTDPGEDLL